MVHLRSPGCPRALVTIHAASTGRPPALASPLPPARHAASAAPGLAPAPRPRVRLVGGNHGVWRVWLVRRRGAAPALPTPAPPLLSSTALADGVSPALLARPPSGVPAPPPPPLTKTDAAFEAGGVSFAYDAASVSLDDLNDLFARVGFPRRDPARLAVALAGTRSVVSATALRGSRWAKAGQLLAFARATSDGALAATVWDVAVHPAWQRGGLGRAVVERVARECLSDGVPALTLYAEPNVTGMYAKLGFVDGDGMQGVRGMAWQKTSVAGAALLARAAARKQKEASGGGGEGV